MIVTGAPPLCDHLPVPVNGVFPTRFMGEKRHTSVGVPAVEAGVGKASIVMVTWSDVEQGRLVVVHSKTYTPGVIPVTVVLYEDGKVMMAAGPLTFAQFPVPIKGWLPASVTEETLHKTWSGPAFAIVGCWYTVIETSSE